MTRPTEHADGRDAANPLHARGTFPRSWGEPPTPYDSPARRAWIARHALEQGALFGDPVAARALLEDRREDPQALRERARADAANRLRRQYLVEALRRCP